MDDVVGIEMNSRESSFGKQIVSCECMRMIRRVFVAATNFSGPISPKQNPKKHSQNMGPNSKKIQNIPKI